MEQKIKIAVIGLVVLLFISFLIILGVLGSKQALQREIEQLNTERTMLRKQADDIALQKRQIEDKFAAVNNDLKKITQERQELQGKYELLDKAREDLLEQIKALKAKPQAQEIPVRSALSASTELAPPSGDAYWGGLLKTKTDLEFQLNAVRSELKNFQINNEQLQREKAGLEMDIVTFTRDNRDLKRQLEYNQKILDSVSSEISRERNDKTSIQESLKVIRTENAVLKRQIKSLSTRKVNLERKLAELQDKNSTLDRRFNEMEQLLNSKISSPEAVKSQISSPQRIKDDAVELAPITVRPQETQASAVVDNYTSRAKIVAINRDNNFVIIDIGQNSGVKAGDKFQAYRDGNPVAKLDTIQVRENIAACDITKEFSPVKVGDTVR